MSGLPEEAQRILDMLEQYSVDICYVKVSKGKSVRMISEKAAQYNFFG